MMVRKIGPLAGALLAATLAACGGAAAPASTAPAAPSSAAAKPASPSASAKPAASASAKPAASASAKPAASGSTAAKPAASGSGVAVPAIPAPVAVTLDPTNTAFLVLDITSANCSSRPACVSSVPNIANLLKKARDAKVPVVYSSISTPGATILPEVAPQQGEPSVTASADKFAGTDLDNILKQKKATNLVMVGTAANGAVMYTSFAANQRGYTVVVAEDGISSANPFDTTLARWQMLNEPGFTNADNKPAAEKQVTLSRSDLITFGTAAAKPAASAAGSASAKPAASGSAAAKPAATGSASGETVPAVPAEVPVSVDPKTTALLVLDFNSAVCQRIPACVSSLPTVAGLIKKARDAKASVIYSSTPNATTLPDVAPQGDEPTVTSSANKFYNTNLADVLKQKQIKTVVVTGVASNGAVLYTSFGATAGLGLTAVVADDAITAADPFATAITKYQLLRFPANKDNKPLADKAVTLSKSDLITFKAA